MEVQRVNRRRLHPDQQAVVGQLRLVDVLEL